MKVSAVVVSHGHRIELESLLPALVPQVDETVVVANIGDSVGAVPEGVRVVENERPRNLAANVNRGVRETTGELVLFSNPDAVPRPGAVRVLRGFMEDHPRAGITGPQALYPDGRWQPTRRRFPTVAGTLVRRTPLRLLLDPLKRQRSHYLLDERPTDPVEADWLLGFFVLMRREMLDEIGGWDEGFRHYGEDIDLAYRAHKAGWEVWYVPGAIVEHEWAQVIDRRFLTRHTLWHLRGMLRFVRKHPERLKAIR
jgi:N-acetylglucosaminyl-diphospho-decaprenol L-rhamnosyltransferase